MRLSSLYLQSRATFMPSFKSYERQKYHVLLDRTFRLPRPLLQNIAEFLPLCRMWNRQLRYLIYETPFHPHRVVVQSIRIIDEVLHDAALEQLSSFVKLEHYRGHPHAGHAGHLTLLRDSPDYCRLFSSDCRFPMTPEMTNKLRRLADIQGVNRSYPTVTAIQFGIEVAQDTVATLTDLLQWDAARKRMELF